MGRQRQWHLPRERDVARATRLAVRRLRAIVGLPLGAVDVLLAVVVLRVRVRVRVLLLLLLLLLVLADLAVRDRGDGGESMRRVHGCAVWWIASLQVVQAQHFRRAE